jgi:hypothetical protein
MSAVVSGVASCERRIISSGTTNEASTSSPRDIAAMLNSAERNHLCQPADMPARRLCSSRQLREVHDWQTEGGVCQGASHRCADGQFERRGSPAGAQRAKGAFGAMVGFVLPAPGCLLHGRNVERAAIVPDDLFAVRLHAAQS